MKLVYIVGTGTNGTGSLTYDAWRAIEDSELLIGAGRMLEPYADKGIACVTAVKAEDIASAILESGMSKIAVLMSGDVGFYSGASSLLPLLTDCETTLIPGISSVNAFFAKIKKPWQNAQFVSLHGRESDIVAAVRRNTETFCITGGGVSLIAELLCIYGFGGLKVYVGENLGYEDEKITLTSVKKLCEASTTSLCVLFIENDEARAEINIGIADEDFLRGEAPMTKAEVRAVTLSKLRLKPEDICYDIGAGTGSVSVEMALSCYKGKVYAVERDEDALPLIRKNTLKHRVANIDIISGEAPEALQPLPAPDAAFIGGSGGNLAEVIDLILDKNKYARIVVNAITLETLHLAVSALEDAGIVPETVQISVSKTRKLGRYNLLTAQNPVFIISGQAEIGEI
jgi:precorrin-6Y C5,15-methyltransferase (decarboxylating)